MTQVDPTILAGEVESASEGLSLTISGGIAEILLCKAGGLNQIDEDAHRALIEIFRSLRRNNAVRVVILSAVGKAFCAGGDFDYIDKISRLSPLDRLSMVREGRELFNSISEMPQPLITALTGDAVGLGATIALASDLVVAWQGARISDPHVLVGLVAGDGGCIVWPAHVGTLRAKRYLLTGDKVPAELAYQLGLITDLVCDREAVMPTARELAARLAGLSPLAVQGTKLALNQGVQARAVEVLDLSFAYEALAFGSSEVSQAIAALRPRPPAASHGA